MKKYKVTDAMKAYHKLMTYKDDMTPTLKNK